MLFPDYYEWLRTLRAKQNPEPEPEKPDLAPSPAGDPPVVARCDWQKGHGPLAVWYVPRDGRWYCAEHLRRILAIAWWKP